MTNLKITDKIVEVDVPEHWKRGVGVRSSVIEALVEGVLAQEPLSIAHDKPVLDDDRHVISIRLYFWGEPEPEEDLEAKHQQRVEKLVGDHQAVEREQARQNRILQEQVNTLNGFMRRIAQTNSGMTRNQTIQEWLGWKSGVDVRRIERGL